MLLLAMSNPAARNQVTNQAASRAVAYPVNEVNDHEHTPLMHSMPAASSSSLGLRTVPTTV